MLKSKIHGAVITKKELYYAGSIGIDKKLLLESDMLPGEKVQVLNFNNGQRFETYVIEEKENILVLPDEAISTENGQSVVKVLEKGKLITIPIETGLETDTETEILKGLDENDQVVID